MYLIIALYKPNFIKTNIEIIGKQIIKGVNVLASLLGQDQKPFLIAKAEIIIKI